MNECGICSEKNNGCKSTEWSLYMKVRRLDLARERCEMSFFVRIMEESPVTRQMIKGLDQFLIIWLCECPI